MEVLRGRQSGDFNAWHREDRVAGRPEPSTRRALPRAAVALPRILVALAMTQLTPQIAEAEPTASAERERMVERQLEARGISDRRVLEAMRKVPRHSFVPASLRDHAYEDRPLPIGNDQTISQPYIVGVMTELLDPASGDTVLEIGTGSGYQAAVLSELVRRVYSIEIVDELAESARKKLAALGYDNVTVIAGDGYRGLPDQAPFDGIIVTAAPEKIPQPLIDQLAVGGRLVIPVGGMAQELIVLERSDTGIQTRRVLPVRFVPMTGEVRDTH
jgi:protein-L-isoaspartate(D-aspartate) O-methyltransferase